MQHTESSIKIYHTKEYSRFNMITGNRQLVQLTIKKIMTDIENGLDILRYCPIICEEKGGRLNIVDGQHRFYVARKIKSTVWYIIAEPFEVSDIAKINSNSQKWKAKDFIDSFITQGNKEYGILQDFMDKYNFPLSLSMLLLSRGLLKSDGGVKETPKDDFQKGMFKVMHAEKANEIAMLAHQFIEFPGYKSGSFVVALCKIMAADVCNIDDLVRKFKKDPTRLTKQRGTKEYLTNLEVIYNVGAHTRLVIF